MYYSGSALHHPLDNPIWQALRTDHAVFAMGDGRAARYLPAVAPFVAVADDDPRSAAQLAALIAPGEHAFGVGVAPAPRDAFRVESHGPIAQMTCDSPLTAVSGPAITVLTEAHYADMLELTALVYPEYFRPRTPEMGRYLGIYDGGRLAAMAGERMHTGNFREISAVCTHPDYLGRGLARQLMTELCNHMLRRGETPFLHVSRQNHRAKALYDRLGFLDRCDIEHWALERLPAGMDVA